MQLIPSSLFVWFVDKYLDFYNKKALIMCCSNFRRLIKITKLPFEFTDKITDKILQNYPFLTELDASRNSVTDEGLKHLPFLRKLNASGNTRITDKSISQLTCLESLYSDKSPVTDVGIKRLKLTHLMATGEDSKITDAGIYKMTSLTDLWISNNRKITDKSVIKLRNLTRLRITGKSTVSDASLKGLKLTLLDAEDNLYVTNAGVANLTTLTCLYTPPKLTGNGVKNLKLLKELYICGGTVLSDNSIRNLPICQLDAPGNCGITDNGVKHLQSLYSLICDDNPYITDLGIMGLKKLHDLGAGGTSGITDYGIKYLKIGDARCFGNPNVTCGLGSDYNYDCETSTERDETSEDL
jgi:hypothetical protein